MKKIITISLLFIIIASIFYNYCYGFEIGTKQLKDLGRCEAYLAYQGAPQHTNIIVYEKDGKQYPAYCLNKDLNGIGSGGVSEYSVIAESKIADEKVWRAIINGYPYKSLNELGVTSVAEAFTATKFAVYTILYNQNPADYIDLGFPASIRTLNAYKKIVNAAKASTESIQSDISISIIPCNAEWNFDKLDNNYVSKSYTLNSVVTSGIYKINLAGDLPENIKITDINNNETSSFKLGEKFKILIPVNSLTKANSFSINATSAMNTKPVAYGVTTVPGTQNYAIAGFMQDDSRCIYNEKTLENLTKIIIIKKEYGTDKVLKGVKFNLLDSNKNVTKENLITDENGKIVIKGLLPGKYYIQETETLENYNLYTDLIEVDLKFNEEFEITVNNTYKQITQIDKNFEKVEVINNDSETIYNITTRTNTINKKLPKTGY